MKNKRILFSVGLFIIFGWILIFPVLGESNENQKLDLEDIKIGILIDNIELERYNDRVMIATYKLDKAEEEKGGSTTIEFKKRRDYYPREARMNLNFAKWERSQKEKELILKGKEYYYTYLLLEEEILLQEGKINRIKDSLQDVLKRVEVGLEKESAISSVELSIENEEFTLRSLNNSKHKMAMELNILMNADMNAEINIEESDIPFEEYKYDNLEERIEKAIKENGEIIRLDEEESLTYLESSIYRDASVGDENEDRIIELNEDAVEKGHDLEDKKISAEYDIRSSYNSLLNSFDEITIKELHIKNLEIDLDIAKKRLEAGLITESVLEELEEQQEFEQLNLKKAKLDYFLAVESFKYSLE